MKHGIYALATAVIILFLCGVSVDAAEVIEWGKCGEDLFWSVTDEGELSITGTGDMYNYDSSLGKYTPWRQYKINKVSVAEGVTGIGNYAFAGLYYVDTVTLPNSVERIGNMCFYRCRSLISFSIGRGLINTILPIFLSNK